MDVRVLGFGGDDDVTSIHNQTGNSEGGRQA